MVPQEIVPDNETLSEAFRQFLTRSQRALERALLGTGASFAQAKMLQSISGREMTRSTDLAALHGVSPRTVTEIIDGMERAGLVVRTPDMTDRRVKNLTLTPAGAAAAIAAEKVRRRFTNAVFASLDDRDRLELAVILDKLSERLASL